MEQPKFESWAVVEIMGHLKLAGLCSEQNVAGVNMLRVDVPETTYSPAFSRLFGGSSIYSITPVDEATAKAMAQNLQQRPLEAWTLQSLIEKETERKKLLSAAQESENDIDYDF